MVHYERIKDYEEMTPFEKAVRKALDYALPDSDSPNNDPELAPDEGFCPDNYRYDDYEEFRFFPKKRDKNNVIYEFESRKATPLYELPAQLELYFTAAKDILKIGDIGKRYQALGRLYDDIDKENGGYLDDSPKDCFNYAFSQELAEELGLIKPNGKKSKVNVLKDYLQRVEKLITQGDDVTNIGGEATIIEGWDWNPVEGIFPAVVILEWLMISVRKEMRYLYWRACKFEDIPKHRFLEYGHWDEEINESQQKVEYVYVEEQKYVTDNTLDPSDLPEWITGNPGSEESKSVEDKTEANESPLEDGKNKKVPEKQAGTLPLSLQETPPQKEGMKDHIDEIDEKTARCLYKALSNKEEPRKVDWLVAPLDENEFVRRLFANPPNPEKKITLEKPSQVKHITEHYLFPKDKPKKGRERRNYTHGEWDVIKKIFDTEPISKNLFDTASLNPRNCQNLDALMSFYKRNSKK